VAAKRIGVVAALTAEAQAYADADLSPGRVHEVCGHLLYVSGVGHANARSAAGALVEGGAVALVSWGTAGALAEGLKQGMVVLPRAVHSARGTAMLDTRWRDHLHSRLREVVAVETGTLLQSEAILISAAAKTNERARCGAIAVDMESAAIADVAAHHRLPCVAVRAILDTAVEAIPPGVLDPADEFGRSSAASIALALARRPLDVIPLIRLGRGLRAALGSLRRVRRHLGPDLGLGSGG
jgi:adenosylhomocysteine nucleosidase